MKPPEELNRIADVVLNYRHDPKCTTAPKPKKLRRPGRVKRWKTKQRDLF
jgi:hypothetical protein